MIHHGTNWPRVTPAARLRPTRQESEPEGGRGSVRTAGSRLEGEAPSEPEGAWLAGNLVLL